MSNGCGCESGLLKYVKPPYAKFFYAACVCHDEDYEKGGSEQDRKDADVSLFLNMHKTVIRKSRIPYSIVWYSIIALLYYICVRLFGRFYFNYTVSPKDNNFSYASVINFATTKKTLKMNWKIIFSIIGGGVGWLMSEFSPTFPLIIVAIIFILYDAWTAYLLDKRVHRKYPEKTKRRDAKFTSFAFGKVVRSTIPKRLWLIVLAYLVEHWVFIHVSIPLSYIVTGVICFEQAWSIFENESSCRSENESRFWKMLQKIMIDKTSRHFDVPLDILKEENGKDTD